MSNEEPRRLVDILTRPSQLWQLLRDYLGLGRRRRQGPIDDAAELQNFLQTRAAFVAQTSLYGYLRTRAGMRYPELFHDESFVGSINIAKWHLWLACLSDIAVYAGAMLVDRIPGSREQVAELIPRLVENILLETGIPADAGEAFEVAAEQVRNRLAQVNWVQFNDDHALFTESPPALVKWAPVIDELKELDKDIVTNSVRFRWQEVRSDLRTHLDAQAILGVEETLGA